MIIQTGKTLRRLPQLPDDPDDLDQPEERLKQIGILKHAQHWTFGYEVEWHQDQVSIDFLCRGNVWTKGRLEQRTQESLGILKVFLEALGIPERFQSHFEAHRERLVEQASKFPFTRDKSSPSFYAVALVGRPSSRIPVGASDVGNSFTDVILQCLQDLNYGLLQVIFKGTKLPRSCFVQPFMLQNQNRSSGYSLEGSTRNQAYGYRREPSARDQYLELLNLDYFQTGAFMAEVRMLLADPNYQRVLGAQHNLIPVLRHYELKVIRYPCWYKFKRLASILPALRNRIPVTWQRIPGRRLMQLVRLPQRNYPGLNRITPASLLAFEAPLSTDPGDIVLGNPIIDGKELSQPFTLPLPHLSTHLGVWGRTGTGKSRFVYGLVRDLAQQGFSLTLFDPKGEYGAPLSNEELIKDHLVILQPGSEAFPFRLNIFEVPSGISEEDHLGFLHSTLMNLFRLQDIEVPPQMEAVFMETLRYAVTNRLTFEGLLDVLSWSEKKLIKHLDVQGTRIDWSALAIANRLRALTYGVCGEVFSGETNISIEKLLDKVCIVDLSLLEGSENVQGRKIFIEVFTHYLLNHLRHRYSSIHQAGGIEHFIVVEEAQKLVPLKVRPIYSDEQTLLGKLPWTLRGYGVATVYAGTEPEVEKPILHNTGMSVVFYSKYEPEVLANLLGLTIEDYTAYREIQSLLGPTRIGLVALQGRDNIFLLKTKHVALDKSPVGLAALQQRMHKQSRRTQRVKQQAPPQETETGQTLDDKIQALQQRLTLVQDVCSRLPPALHLEVAPTKLSIKLVKQALSIHPDYANLNRTEQVQLLLQKLGLDIPPDDFWKLIHEGQQVYRLQGRLASLERKKHKLSANP